MRFNLLICTLVYLAAAAPSRPVHEPMFGHPELAMPSFQEGKRAVQDFSWTHKDGRILNLNYDVTHVDDPILALDQELSVITLKNCSSLKALTLVMEDEAAAEAMRERLTAEEHLMSGGAHWGCTDASQQIRAVLRRVLFVEDMDYTAPTEVVLRTAGMQPHQFFKHARVSLTQSAFPEDHFKEVSNLPEELGEPMVLGTLQSQDTAAEGATNRRRLSRFSNFFHHVVNKVKSVFHKVVTVVKKVVAVAKGVFQIVELGTTGNYKTFKSWNLLGSGISYNFNSKTASASNKYIAVDSALTCTNCYFDLAATVNFNLDIQGYTLNTFELYAEGYGRVGAQGTIKGTANAVIANTVSLATVHSAPYCVTIGVVPFCMHITIPVDVSYNFTASATASLNVNAVAHGNIKAGLNYVPGSGLKWFKNQSFTHSGNRPAFKADVSVSAVLDLQPTVMFDVDHIGGPYVGFSGGLEAMAVYDSSGSPCNSGGGGGITASLNAYLHVRLGANIDLVIAGHTLYKYSNAATVYAGKFPLGSWCWSYGGGAPPAALPAPQPNTVAYPAMLYTGRMLDYCTQMWVHVNAQFMENNQWALTHSMTIPQGQYQASCTVQGMYDATYPVAGLAPRLMNWAEVPDAQITYKGCMGVDVAPPAPTGQAFINADYSQLFITPSNNCYSKVALSRAPST